MFKYNIFELDNVRSTPKSVEIILYEVEKIPGDFSHSFVNFDCIYEFDSTGRKKSCYYLNRLTRKDYLFNADSDILKEYNYEKGFVNFRFTRKYYYGMNNNLIKIQVDTGQIAMPETIKYTYDSNNKIVDCKYSSPFANNYEYKVFRLDSNVIFYFFDNKNFLFSKIIAIYDSLNNLLCETDYTFDNVDLGKYEKVNYLYHYDSIDRNKNWTTVHVYKDNYPYEVIKRNIKY